MEYKSITLNRALSIDSIYSVHYFEYPKDFIFPGEKHDFWELVCVDAGNIVVQADSQEYNLQKGEMIFHRPNEFHALRADGHTSPSLFVISFSCHADCMRFFEQRLVKINPTEHFYLGQILSEAQLTFSTNLHNPFINQLSKRNHISFGSEQVLLLTLELLLISIYRRYNPIHSVRLFEPAGHPVNPMAHKDHTKILQEAEQYMHMNVYKKLTVADICRAAGVGRSTLQKICNKERGYGIMESFTRIRIEEAKRLIRDGKHTFSQIADELNYSSYQFFSLQFKKYTNLSPSEYRSSIRSYAKEALEEGQEQV